MIFSNNLLSNSPPALFNIVVKQGYVFKSETTSFHHLSPRIPKIQKSLDIGLWEVGAKRRLDGVNKWKISVKKISLRRFYTLYEEIFLNLRIPLSVTFPQGFQKSQKLGHLTLGSRGKKTVKRSEKVWHTKTHTDFFTYRKNLPRGPILWKYSYNKGNHTLYNVKNLAALFQEDSLPKPTIIGNQLKNQATII